MSHFDDIDFVFWGPGPRTRVEPVSPTLEAISPGLLSYLEALKVQLTELTAKVDALAKRKPRHSVALYRDRIKKLREHFGAEAFNGLSAAMVLGLPTAQDGSAFLRRMVAKIAELIEHDPYACLMAYWATKPDPDGVRAFAFFKERAVATFPRTYDPSTMTITIDGVELTDVSEISYGRKKAKR